MPQWREHRIRVGGICFIRISEKALVLNRLLKVNSETVREALFSPDALQRIHFHPCGEGFHPNICLIILIKYRIWIT